MPLNFYLKQTDDARDLPVPSYMTDGAAGMDLYANVRETLTVPRFEIRLVPTGIKIEMPEGFEAQIRPRSGLALNFGISMPNSPGTIDADYRGEIKVPLINLGKEDFSVKRGDRIGQMVINRIERIQWNVLAAGEELSATERGENGYGHTGDNIPEVL